QPELGAESAKEGQEPAGGYEVQSSRFKVQSSDKQPGTLNLEPGTLVPFIHFGTNTSTLLDLMKGDGGTTIGVDWRIPLDVAWEQIGYDLGIQGNLDAAVLYGPDEFWQNRALEVLRQAGGRSGHIFNLG